MRTQNSTRKLNRNSWRQKYATDMHDRFKHEVFHEGAADFAWREHVGGSLVAASGHDNMGNYSNSGNGSVEHVRVHVDG